LLRGLRGLIPGLAAAGLLAGCSSLRLPELSGMSGGALGTSTVVAAAPAPAAPSDPLAAFAASAAPGTEGVVQGQRVRLARAYAAASGRECRELLVGSGAGERSALVCRDEVSGWALTRPLLRGGGVMRP
jgi:hypothetical protein